MKRKVLLILPLTMFTLLGGCKSEPQISDKYELEFTLNEDNLSYSVTGIAYDSKDIMHDVVIPDTYENLPVTILGNKEALRTNMIKNVFEQDKTLKSLVMGNNITTLIGDGLCSGANNLESITFSNKLKEALGNNTFCYINEIKEVVLPETLLTLNMDFLSFTSVEKLVLPKNMDNIPIRAFASNESLTDITWPEVDFRLGPSCFCVSGLTELIMPDNMQSAAFSSSKYLTKVVCGHGLKALSGAFMNCENLTQFTLNKECTSIFYSNTGERQSSFYGCTSLHSINYEGTIAEWADVYKEANWNTSGCEINSVICSDGTIEL